MNENPEEIKKDSCVWVFGRKGSGKTRLLLSYLTDPDFYYFDSMNQIEKIQKDIGKQFPPEIRKRIFANAAGPERIKKDPLVKEMILYDVFERLRREAFEGRQKVIAIDELHFVLRTEGQEWLESQFAGLRTHGVGIWGMSHRPVVTASQTMMDLTGHLIVFPLPRDTSRRHDRRDVEQMTGQDDLFTRLDGLEKHSYAHYVEATDSIFYHSPVKLPGWLK